MIIYRLELYSGEGPYRNRLNNDALRDWLNAHWSLGSDGFDQTPSPYEDFEPNSDLFDEEGTIKSNWRFGFESHDLLFRWFRMPPNIIEEADFMVARYRVIEWISTKKQTAFNNDTAIFIDKKSVYTYIEPLLIKLAM